MGEKTIQERANEFANNFLEETKKELAKVDSELNKDNPNYEIVDEVEESLRNNYGVELKQQIVITLGGGGPASRIVWNPKEQLGEIQFQDWFEPWTSAKLNSEQEKILIQFLERYFPLEIFI
tara:strand:+ start:1584 stop:1949 length:366 start_codon:yes stop_codon:yes gene_type:complete